MSRAEVLAAVKRIYEEHGHPDDWGVQVIYVDSMLAHLDAALAAQEGERGGAEVAAAVEALLTYPDDATLGRYPRWIEDELRAALADPAGALATHDAEVLRAFVEWVSSQKAYNGADRAGQALYDYGLNVVLRGWAEEWLEARS